MSVRAVASISVAGAVALAMTATAFAETPAPPAQPAQQQVTVTCELIEIWASHGKAAIDPAIPKQLANRLTANFKWTEYKQLSTSSKKLEKKKPETAKLKKGGATLTLVEIVDGRQIRMTIDFAAAKGKSSATPLFAASDWVTTVVNQTKKATEAHILALSCK